MAIAPKPDLTLLAGDQMLERHYSPAELGELWNLSDDSIRRMFENEPSVLIFEAPEKCSGRRRRTIRIPESVAQRVYRRLSTRPLDTIGTVRHTSTHEEDTDSGLPRKKTAASTR
jgi:hypothetical protein